MESVAATLKRLTLELGGNDAAIVLDDVDPKEVAPKVFAGAMTNSGQVCLAIKRLYVHDSQYDAMREEQFGPVLPVLRYSDIDDVIARANDTTYGRGGTVWSSDLDRAFDVAAKIDSGTVWINQHLDLPNEIPFAGAKQSGIGVEMGIEGLEEFTQAKIINIAKS
jgi:acyl-CoA reductase-like NAD-dependent aldehyde dehydrogenase